MRDTFRANDSKTPPSTPPPPPPSTPPPPESPFNVLSKSSNNRKNRRFASVFIGFELIRWAKKHTKIKKSIANITDDANTKNGKPLVTFQISTVLRQSPTSCGFFATLNMIKHTRLYNDLEEENTLKQVVDLFDLSKPEATNLESLSVLQRDAFNQYAQFVEVDAGERFPYQLFTDVAGMAFCYIVLKLYHKTENKWALKVEQEDNFTPKTIHVQSPMGFGKERVTRSGQKEFALLTKTENYLGTMIRIKYDEDLNHFVSVINGLVYDSYEREPIPFEEWKQGQEIIDWAHVIG